MCVFNVTLWIQYMDTLSIINILINQIKLVRIESSLKNCTTVTFNKKVFLLCFNLACYESYLFFSLRRLLKKNSKQLINTNISMP